MKDSIEEIIKLSYIEVSENEKKEMVMEVEKVLNYCHSLDDCAKVSIKDIEQKKNNVFREDNVSTINISEDILKLAPLLKDKQIKVKKILSQ